MIQPLAPGSWSVQLRSGLERQFAGAEELLAVDASVDDPAIDPAVARRRDDRLQVVVLLEVRVDVLFPVELADDEVEVVVLVLGHVLHQQRPGHVAAFDERLEHAEHVAAPLRLVGAERAGRVQHAGRNQPAGAALEAIGRRQIEDAVVALVPVLQAAADLLLSSCRARGP